MIRDSSPTTSTPNSANIRCGKWKKRTRLDDDDHLSLPLESHSQKPQIRAGAKETCERLPLHSRVPIWFPSMALALALYGRQTGALPLWKMEEARPVLNEKIKRARATHSPARPRHPRLSPVFLKGPATRKEGREEGNECLKKRGLAASLHCLTDSPPVPGVPCGRLCAM